MKRGASLVLTELVIMLLVFALASAFCVQAFVWADSSSRQSAAADMALIQAQNAAELLKHYHGDFSPAVRDYGGQWDGTVWTVSYDENWNMTADNPVYFLQAERAACKTAYLGQAKLTVLDQEGTVLAELSVCWQEVAP